ncbi:MAG: leucine-rich repeat domain-containing protein, partial [Treponema sp.]|nr:leucine-rich repeat domain-containing protein [Treponema sp.]
KNVTIPARINNLPVAAIGAGAYYYNRLTGITIPNSVTHIGFWAFIGNQLTSVIIPNTVIFIADNAFDDNVRIIRR